MKILNSFFSNLFSKETVAKQTVEKKHRSVMTNTLKKNLQRHNFSNYTTSKQLREFKELCDYCAKNGISHRIIT